MKRIWRYNAAVTAKPTKATEGKSGKEIDNTVVSDDEEYIFNDAELGIAHERAAAAIATTAPALTSETVAPPSPKQRPASGTQGDKEQRKVEQRLHKAQQKFFKEQTKVVNRKRAVAEAQMADAGAGHDQTKDTDFLSPVINERRRIAEQLKADSSRRPSCEVKHFIRNRKKTILA